MIKILIVFGTRPEAIKMAPLVNEFKKYPETFDTKICVTAQHRHMLDQVLEFFEIVPEFDLDLMRPNQNLHQLTADVILALRPVISSFKPDFVFVHGDTTTSMGASIAAFYSETKVCHVEAGLRTYDKQSPFPEEINRQITSRIADIHFAPTETSKNNLLREAIPVETIHKVGNTVIDALDWATEKLKIYEDEEIIFLKNLIDPTKKIVLVTGHRRENFGGGFLNICDALVRLEKREDVQIIYPVHLNPMVQEPVYKLLAHSKNIHLISPLKYPAFVWLMDKSYIILTDSGGIQEEAPSLGKPVLVMRENTERPEAVDAGTVILVGTDVIKIVENAEVLLDNLSVYKAMSTLHNPYGEGNSSKLIVKTIMEL